MLDRYLKDEAAVQRMRALPVGSHLDAFAAVLSALGYARDSIRDRLWTLAALGRWPGSGVLRSCPRPGSENALMLTGGEKGSNTAYRPVLV
jgi:hypothetical protein